MSTLIICILVLIAVAFIPSFAWWQQHNLTYIPIMISVLFLIFMVCSNLKHVTKIFGPVEYVILILLIMYQAWQIYKR